MPTRGRGKPSASSITQKPGKPHRQSTQFGELETTPTSRHRTAETTDAQESTPTASHQPSSSRAALHDLPPPSTDEFDNGLNDADFRGVCATPHDQKSGTKATAWSEAPSTTRRSTPLKPGETPSVPWQLQGDVSADVFSPISGKGDLPDTAPLPAHLMIQSELEMPIPKRRRVDFSETASTGCRSSPLRVDDDVEAAWVLGDDAPHSAASIDIGNGPFPEPMPQPIDSSSHVLYAEAHDIDSRPTGSTEITSGQHNKKSAPQDSPVNSSGPSPPISDEKEDKTTYRKPARKRKPGIQKYLESGDEVTSPQAYDVQPTSRENGLQHQTKEQDMFSLPHSGGTPNMEPPLAKKRKQRPKSPLPFDEKTQKIKYEPKVKKIVVPARMPIVTKLRDSVSVSPAIVPQKRPARKGAQAKKKRTPAEVKKANTAKPRQAKAAQSTKTKAVQPKGQLESPPRLDIETRGRARRRANLPEPPKPPNFEDGLLLLSSDHSDREDVSFVAASPAMATEPPSIEHASHTVDRDDDDNHQVTNAAQKGPSLPKQALRPGKQTESSSQNVNTPNKSVSVTEFTLQSQKVHAQTPIAESPDSLPSVRNILAQSSEAGSNRKLVKPRMSVTTTEVVSKPPAVLFERDPNMRGRNDTVGLVKQALVNNNVNSKVTPDERHSFATRVRQKIPSERDISRKISVSERGSPVRMQTQTQVPTILVDDESFLTSGSSEEEAICEPQQCRARVLDTHPLPISSFRQSTHEAAAKKDLRTAVGNGTNVGKAASAQTEPTHLRRLEELSMSRHQLQQDHRSSAHAEILRTHIMAGLQIPNDGPSNQRAHAQGQAQKPDKMQDAVRSSSVGRHLHEAVDLLMKNLTSKEGPIEGLPDIYRAKTLDIVGQIQINYVREQDGLRQTCSDDVHRFTQGVQHVKSAIERNNQDRERTGGGFEETMANRRHLYDRATISLQSMHRQLMRGSMG